MITSNIITAGAITSGTIMCGPRVEMFPDGTVTFHKRSEEEMEGEDMHPGGFTLEDRDGASFISVTPHDRPGKVTVKTSPDGITLTRPMLDMLTQAMNRGRDYRGQRDDR